MLHCFESYSSESDWSYFTVDSTRLGRLILARNTQFGGSPVQSLPESKAIAICGFVEPKLFYGPKLFYELRAVYELMALYELKAPAVREGKRLAR